MTQKAFFVTGTNTGIGKTIASAALCRALDADYYKPVQSGIADGDDDCKVVQDLTGLSDARIHRPIYALQAPLSPHEAARLEGVEIDLDKLTLPDIDGRNLIVEGAGGVLVPLNDDALMIDLMAKMNLPVVIVASSGLGTINHTLLTIEALRHREIEIAGVILNGDSSPANKKAIEVYGNVKVIGEIPLDQGFDL
ncbi:MAG: dethiobiotin synthase [Alphaproteobacteria bacterium]